MPGTRWSNRDAEFYNPSGNVVRVATSIESRGCMFVYSQDTVMISYRLRDLGAFHYVLVCHKSDVRLREKATNVLYVNS